MATTDTKKPEQRDIRETMDHAVASLKKSGKAKVHVANEAAGSTNVAEQILLAAARMAGVEVTLKEHKVTVAATVVEHDAE